MPNVIELNLLNNKSIVATMQGHPLANENSYKIIAGEENATKFIIKSIPNQYANARLTVEMVNSQGLGIAERKLSEIEVDLVSYKGFILPVGMAVAGYGYVSIKAYLDNSSTTIENGTVSVDYTKLAPYIAYTFIYNGSAWELNKNVVNLSTYGITISGTPKENDIIQVREKVVFQPLKLKVWNTIPQWQDYVDKTTNVRVENGYLILTENGTEYNLGYVQGEDGKTPYIGGNGNWFIGEEDTGVPAKCEVSNDYVNEQIDKAVSPIKKDIADLYLLSNATVTGTEELSQAYDTRQTADGMDIIDGALTRVEKIEGATVKSSNLIPSFSGTSTNGGLTYTGSADGTITITGTLTVAEGSSNKNSTITIVSLKNLTAGTYTYHLNASNYTGLNGHVSLYTRAGNWIKNLGSDGSKGFTFTLTEDDLANETRVRLNIWFLVSETTEINITCKPMLNEGSTALPYRPYFSGLKNAYFEGVKSTGTNLLKPYGIERTVTHRGITFTLNADGSVVLNGQNDGTGDSRITLIEDFSLKAGTYSSNISKGSLYLVLNSSAKNKTIEFRFYNNQTSDKNYDDFVVWVIVGSGDTTVYNNHVIYPMLNIGSTVLPYEQYEETNLSLSSPIELGKWDYIDFERKKIVRQTAYLTQATAFTEEELAIYNDYVLSVDGLSIAYKTETATEESIFIPTNKYTVWNGGSETVIQGETDNSADGAMPTITQIYVVKRGTSV